MDGIFDAFWARRRRAVATGARASSASLQKPLRCATYAKSRPGAASSCSFSPPGSTVRSSPAASAALAVGRPASTKPTASSRSRSSGTRKSGLAPVEMRHVVNQDWVPKPQGCNCRVRHAEARPRAEPAAARRGEAREERWRGVEAACSKTHFHTARPGRTCDTKQGVRAWENSTDRGRTTSRRAGGT